MDLKIAMARYLMDGRKRIWIVTDTFEGQSKEHVFEKIEKAVEFFQETRRFWPTHEFTIGRYVVVGDKYKKLHDVTHIYK